MRVQLSDPAHLDDLIEFLERSSCVVEQTGSSELRVSIPKSLRPDAERLELALYLRVWEVTHPGIEAAVVR
jgi:hypothetical protein